MTKIFNFAFLFSFLSIPNAPSINEIEKSDEMLGYWRIKNKKIKKNRRGVVAEVSPTMELYRHFKQILGNTPGKIKNFKMPTNAYIVLKPIKISYKLFMKEIQ